LRARSDFVGSFSLSRIEVLEHSGRSHDGGVTGTGSISLSLTIVSRGQTQLEIERKGLVY